VGEVVGVEPEDGDCAPVELLDDRIGVLVVVVGDDQYGGRNGWPPIIGIPRIDILIGRCDR
jgi:hypothetical protein